MDNCINIKPSKVLAKLRAGEIVTCVKANIVDPVVTEIAALTGFDCIWLDMEHLPWTNQDILNHIRAAKMHDMDTLVRVERGSYSDLIRPLEMDASGIMVPHLMGLKDALQVVYYTKFHPIGRRPLDGGYADGAYGMLPYDEYMKQANEQRFVIVQIEDPEPMDELEKIAETDGIDMIFFGAGDFSQAVGTPGQYDTPLIIETQKRIAEIARVNGKYAAAVGSIDELPGLIDMGYQFINLDADVDALARQFEDVLKSCKKIIQG